MAKKSKSGRKANTNKKKWIRRAAICCSALLAIIIAAVIWAWSVAGARYDGSEAVRIYIPSGSSALDVADSLRSSLGDNFGSKVAKLWALQKGSAKIAEGSYVIEPGARSINVSRIILHGRQTPMKVTFNNVRTMQQLAQKVTRRLEITPDQFIQGCDSVLPAMGYTREGYPAAFLPDTYEFFWNANADTVVKRLAEARNKFWSDERRQRAADLGLSPVEIATVASIVEEETSKQDERPRVARLYLNRLQKGMMLQADPTVKFAVGDFTLRRITGSHLKIPSPYNTYLHSGLPPGPIRVVERKTLEQVLDASKHDYIYMCAKEDFSGYHNFAVDYNTHMANARRYQAELNKRGIR